MPFYYSKNQMSNFVSCFKNNMRLEFDTYAKGYRFAARTVTEKLLSKQSFPDYNAYPVVFLYRHSFELYLKHIIYSSSHIAAFRRMENIDSKLYKNHDLLYLSEVSIKILKITFPDDNDIAELFKDIKSIAREITDLDKGSFSYRYPIDNHGNPSTQKHQIVNLIAFADCMEEFLTKLDIVNFGIEITKERVQEIYEYFENLFPPNDKL
jgi:hypothetical protein